MTRQQFTGMAIDVMGQGVFEDPCRFCMTIMLRNQEKLYTKRYQKITDTGLILKEERGSGYFGVPVVGWEEIVSVVFHFGCVGYDDKWRLFAGQRA